MAEYEVVAVQRVPNQLTGPTLTELGPLHASIDWTDVLNEAPEATFTVDVGGIQSDIKAALRDLSATPLEVWVYRDSVLQFAGPIVGGQITGKSTLSLTCRGLEFYTAYMLVTADKTFTAVDQFTIVKTLIDDWQALDYGDFGIDTVTVGTSGVTQDLFIPGAEEPRQVYEALRDLAASAGFDFYVKPDRELVLGTRGVDLTTDVFLERGIQSANIQFSVAPGTIASELFGTGTNSGKTPITGNAINAGLRASFGRAGYAISVDGADNAALLTGALTAALDELDDTYFAPGPGLVPVSGAGVTDFGVGDTVTYTYDAGLGQQTGGYRIRKRQVSVSNTGQEFITVEFE